MNEPGTEIERTDRTELPSAPRRNRRALRLLLYLLIFVSGSVVGAGVALIVVRNSALHAVHHPDDMPGLIAARMARALSLSDKQKSEVESILRERQAALQTIRREFQPQVEGQLDQLEEQVSAVLDVEQREKWESRFEYLRRTWVPKPPPGD